MFEVGTFAQFEAAHRLVGDFGPATRLHGHTYRVDVAVRGERLRDDATLMDIDDIRAALAEIVAGLQMRNLDELEVFAGKNTTDEIVAVYIAEALHERLTLPDSVTSLTVRVWEKPEAWASYELRVRG